MESKLIIYYKIPSGAHNDMKSMTLSFSRLNNDNNTYRLKLITEKYLNDDCIQEYKMKEFHLGLDLIASKINQIDFTKDYSKPIFDEKFGYFMIKYGENKIETSNKSEIQYILDLFSFDRLATIPCQHYQYIKDMYEYLSLEKILSSKISDLDGKNLVKLSHMFKTDDPYRLFRNMHQLKYYLDKN